MTNNFNKPTLLKNDLNFSGMFQYILQFLNIVAIVSNSFIIAFTSQWYSSNFTTLESKFECVAIFEVKIKFDKINKI